MRRLREIRLYPLAPFAVLSLGWLVPLMLRRPTFFNTEAVILVALVGFTRITLAGGGRSTDKAKSTTYSWPASSESR